MFFILPFPLQLTTNKTKGSFRFSTNKLFCPSVFCINPSVFPINRNYRMEGIPTFSQVESKSSLQKGRTFFERNALVFVSNSSTCRPICQVILWRKNRFLVPWKHTQNKGREKEEGRKNFLWNFYPQLIFFPFFPMFSQHFFKPQQNKKTDKIPKIKHVFGLDAYFFFFFQDDFFFETYTLKTLLSSHI